MRFAAEGARVLGAVVLGALTAPVEAVFLLVTLPFAGGTAGAARWLARWEARRLRLDPAVLDRASLDPPAGGGDGSRARLFLAARVPLGLLGALVLVLLVFGAWQAGRLVWAWVLDEAYDGMSRSVPLGLYMFTLGGVLLFLALMGLVGVRTLERRLAARMLGPDRTEALERRIAELSESRAGIVAAVDSERRRIERDLHDGLQQRLVALSMLIGRARRGHPDLMDQAHVEAQQALGELREVAWRVYPSGLDALGLQEALAGVAERSEVPVTVSCDLPGRPPPAVEAAAYFVVSEAVTNANKHAGAGRVEVAVRMEGAALVVSVRDDGVGGAGASGGGLSGLRRRVAALDGGFAVDSPPGGPTVIRAELPCG
ncbi:sensor histidine kinase [Nonomuraea sp. NPDC050478]|uniref:sensor histidine kinase n=1 Tax=Nonomuraea sp. NPDC050478 TaxID=3364365 RepID=UPI0037BD5E51